MRTVLEKVGGMPLFVEAVILFFVFGALVPAAAEVSYEATAASRIASIAVGHAMSEVETACLTPEERQRDLAIEMVSGATGAMAKKFASKFVGDGMIGQVAAGAADAYVQKKLDRVLHDLFPDSPSSVRLSHELCEIVKARRLLTEAIFRDATSRMAETCGLVAQEVETNVETLRRGITCMVRTEAGDAALTAAVQNIYTTNVIACAAAEATLRRIERESQREAASGPPPTARVNMGCASPDDFEREWAGFFEDRIRPRQ